MVVMLIVMAALTWVVMKWALKPYTSGEIARSKEVLRYAKAEGREAEDWFLRVMREKHGG